MPDKPTDKKLTFMEWIIRDEFSGKEILAKAAVGHLFKYVILNEKHNEDCPMGECMLCILERMLSDYHEYFKQK